MRGFRLQSTPHAAARQQVELAKKVVTRDDFMHADLVCGVDVSYRQGVARCAAVIVDHKFNIVEHVSTKSVVRQPYIPGLFVLREAGPALHTLKKLKHYDMLMVDGHGLLHPRRCGLASYLGLALNKPTIGVAKSLLCGTVRGDKVEIDGKTLGSVIGARKKLYVSVGHRISLESAVALAMRMTKNGEWLPEPLRLADAYSRL